MKKTLALLLALILLSVSALPAANVLAAPALAKPDGLTATTGGKSGRITLSWSENPDAFGYEIWRSATGKTGSYQLLTGIGGTTYTDAGLKASTPYYYAVRAWALRGSRTVYSAFAKVNLSTRITKSYASACFTRAYKAMNKFTNAYDKNAFENGTAIQAVRDDWYGFYFPFTLKGCTTKADAVNYLKKYLQKKAAKEVANFFLKSIKGKLYIWLPQDPGFSGALVINDVPTLKMTVSDKKAVCKFGTTFVYGFDGEESFESGSIKLTLVYEGGRWVFADDGLWYSFSFPYQTVLTPNDGK